MSNNTPLISCNKCGLSLPHTNEYFHYYTRNGNKRLRHTCKQCLNSHSRSYHKERMTNDPAYKEKRREYTQELRHDSARMEKRRQTARIRYNDRYNNDPVFKTRISEKNKHQYHMGMLDPEYRARRKACSNRRRGHIKAAIGSHTHEDILLQFNSQRGKCWWCGCKLKSNKYHVDHLTPLSKGGSNGASNLVISCSRCNLSKKDRLPYEWIGRLI